MEQARQKALARAHAREHAVIFKGVDQQGGQEYQDEGGAQHYARVQTIFFISELLIPNIAPHHVAHAAYHDERADGEIYERIAHIAGERGKRRAVYAHKVEAGVTEGGDGVEYRKPNAVARAVVGDKANHEQKRADQLDGEGEDDYSLDQLDHAAVPHCARGLRQDYALIKPYPPAEGEGKEGYHGHKAYAAHLDEQDHHYLPEQRPVHKGIVGDEPRHASGGSGRE